METSNIFEALYDYYNRNEEKMPEFGMSNGIPIGHVVVIDMDGKFVRDYENYELDENGKTVMGKEGPIPKHYDNAPFDIYVSGTGVIPHLLYGKFQYFFPTIDGKKGSTECNDAFLHEISLAVSDSSDKSDKSALEAIMKFYENGEYSGLLQRLLDDAISAKDKEMENAKTDKDRQKIEKKPLSDYVKGNFSFQIHGDNGLVIEKKSLYDVFRKYYDRQNADNFAGYGMDSITGKYGKLIKVFPSKSMQATLIGFNNSSSNSHGYSQMGNCPMTLETATKISCAFDYLRGSKKHSITIGRSDETSSLIFWSSSNNVNEVSDDELESDLFNELNRLIGFVASDDKSESVVAEKENAEKVYSVFKGTKTYEHEKDSTYYVATISSPSKGTIYMSHFRSGKIGELYDNLERYQRDFRTFKNRFVSPRMALESCYKRKPNGIVVDGETKSKNHINMRKSLLMSAIFGGKYETPIFSKLIDRIYRESSLEYKFPGGVNRSDRIACIRAYAMQSHVLDEFRYERDLDNLPYQTGAFYGVCEAIRCKYKIARNEKKQEVWKVYNAEFRKGLLNQTNDFIVDKLKTQAKILAEYLDKDEKRRLVGVYSKEQVWTTEMKPNGTVINRGQWKIKHDWGEIDWAIWRMNKLSDQRKGSWSNDDKAMFLVGFYRMFNLLMSVEKKEDAKN